MRIEWECPFCSKASIITEYNYSSAQAWFDIANAHGNIVLLSEFIVCPNPKCREFTLSASMGDYTEVASSTGGRKSIKQWVKRWPLVPASQAKVFPSYVPKPIRDDYVEACLIRDLSPKASATLSRRCLQGMVRDFWNIQKDRLADEIKALKGRVDSVTWDAIDAVRSVGNIGAHMEKDINVMIDVDPEEAAKLIALVELLIQDWYIAREDRKNRLAAVIEVGKEKKEAKENPPAPESQ